MAAIVEATTTASSYLPTASFMPSLPTPIATGIQNAPTCMPVSSSSSTSTGVPISISGFPTPLSSPLPFYPQFGGFMIPTMFSQSFNNIPFDITIKVMYNDDETHKPKEEILFSHKHILVKSGFFRQQLLSALSTSTSSSHPQVIIDLTMIPDALNNFRTLLMYLYSGNINNASGNVNLETLSTLSKLLQIPELEEYLRNQGPNPGQHPFTSMVTTMANAMARNSGADVTTQSQICNLYAQYFLQSQLAASASPPHSTVAFNLGLSNFPSNLPSPLDPNDASSIGSIDRSPTDSTSMLFPASTPPDSDSNEQLIVSNDKEGWCRNKKYIENVPNGYRCTVCRKVYGRYNSVSYHVTIYHRNPPIRCGVEGCPFTTREARYIHFHKYYRHGIKLPESIDLASRKCPYCRHISKSPAMLEKHICRHVQDCLKNGKNYSCLKCNHESKDQKHMYDHLREHQVQAVEDEFKCSKRSSVSESEESVTASSSSIDVLVTPKMTCNLCPAQFETEMDLQQHKVFNHTSQFLDITQANPLTLFAWQQWLLSNSNLAKSTVSLEAIDASFKNLNPEKRDSIASTSSTS